MSPDPNDITNDFDELDKFGIPEKKVEVKATPIPCAACKALDDFIAPTTIALGRPPAKGDITICVKCGEVLLFEDATSLRVADFKDWMNFQKDTTYIAIDHQQAMIKRKIHRKHTT